MNEMRFDVKINYCMFKKSRIGIFISSVSCVGCETGLRVQKFNDLLNIISTLFNTLYSLGYTLF